MQHCSNTIDRSIFEWFCNVEDYCCFLGAHKALLPIDYRLENVRRRQLLAHQDYPRLAPAERKARLLDDLWPQLWALLARLGDVLATMPLLKTMNRPQRSETAYHLKSELTRFYHEFTGFLMSPHVIELLQPGVCDDMHESQHRDCCPSLPFVPIVFEFPPAGLFNIVVQSIHWYVRSTLYPSLRVELDFLQSMPELEAKDPSHYSIEVCRTFAGIEYGFRDSPSDVMFACFPSLMTAALTSPPNLRIWIWCKFAHFEKLGLFTFEPIKKNLSMLWDMPEILRDGFSPLRVKSPQQDTRIQCHESGEAENLEMMSDEDDSLEPLKQLRGLFGLLEADE